MDIKQICPKVSVIIATYNRAKSLGRSIESALAQSHKNIEVIVSDDGSTDQTKEVVQAYSIKDSRVRYIYQENKNCHVYPRNNAINISEGEYIAILDDDDVWCDKDKIRKQVDFLLSHSEYVMVGGGATKVDSNGRDMVSYLLPETDNEIRENILSRNFFVHVSVLYKKDAFEKAGRYDENFDGIEDWDLWMRIGQVGKFYNIPEIFVKYSAHQKNNLGYTEKKYSKWEWLMLNIKLKKRQSKNYPHFIKAFIYCWLGYFYSLLPYRRKFWPIIMKTRSLLFGGLRYKRDGKNQ